MTNYFSDLSIKLTNKLSKDIKKTQGIYFTPISIVSHLVDETLLYFDDEPEYVLEPSCGSCEIVNYIDKKLVNSNIHCIEYNKTIYEEISNLEFENEVKIIHGDFIKYSDNDSSNKYDLIIGNPPYFVCKKEEVPKEYVSYIVGRPNIFGLFILHSISRLKVNGILSFIIPKSFLNSSYYASIRNYIKQTCDILDIIDYENSNHFLETEQSTFGLIIRKNSLIKDILLVSDCDYSLKINGNFIFTPDSYILKNFFAESTTLKNLGLSVKTGTIVWNEKKNILTDNSESTILIYNTNITNNNSLQLTIFKNNEKKQYINIQGNSDPVIVVNRGNGNSTYNFKYSLINIDKPFVVENHLNIIYPTKPIEKDLLLELYSKILNSFEQKKTTDFIKLFFGNNGLSKTELESVLPIYL
jgi:adenine-specific DNA-methyltransferase